MKEDISKCNRDNDRDIYHEWEIAIIHTHD